MKAYIQLTIAQLKLFARNRTVIFWSTFFPLVLMVMLGLFLGGGQTMSINVGWVDYDQSEESVQVKQSFVDVEAVNVTTFNDVDAAVLKLESGELTFIISVPEGFGEQLANDGYVPPLDIYYDEVSQSLAQLGFAVIDQVVDDYNKALTNFEEVVYYEKRGLQSAELSYIDFLVPGIVALMILSSNMNGVAAQISSWRERSILRRLRSSGLSASTFIAAQITARLALNGTQALLVLLVGIFLLGAQMNGSWLLLMIYMLLGVFVFMSIGFIIAGLAKTPEHAAPIAGFLSFPMFFLGGIFFPITNMPDFLQPVVYAIPISHLTEVLRQVMNLGVGPMELWVPSVVLFAWFVGSFALAVKLFRWE